MTVTDELRDLPDTAAGCGEVTTRSGTVYVLDLDQRRLRRQPAGSDQLRRDFEELHLYEVINCGIGRPAIFFVQVREDDIPTYRFSTDVLTIEPTENVDGRREAPGRST